LLFYSGDFWPITTEFLKGVAVFLKLMTKTNWQQIAIFKYFEELRLIINAHETYISSRFSYAQSARKCTYEHPDFQKFSRGLHPRTPAMRGEGRGGEGRGYWP
jgi:hypothetical protein